MFCNRAFLYNQSVVFTDYATKGKDREVFKDFLNSGVIVPYLYAERSPAQKPDFSLNQSAFPAWQQICQETRMHCIRLSWDDDENKAKCNERLALPFHNFALGAYRGNAKRYVRDLGLDQTVAEKLSERLKTLSETSSRLSERKGRPVAREDLYREFVSFGDPAQGLYDGDKPFAAQLKELIDLSYNASLPDALLAYPLTPQSSLARTALQGVDLASTDCADGRSCMTPDEWVRLIKNTAFTLVQNAEYLASFNLLGLEDVAVARSTDEWARYSKSLSSLLANPLDFPDRKRGAPAIFDNYTALVKRITSLVKNRMRDSNYQSWMPTFTGEGSCDMVGVVCVGVAPRCCGPGAAGNCRPADRLTTACAPPLRHWGSHPRHQ